MIDSTFEREPIRFQSVAVEGTYNYLNPPASNTATSNPMEWSQQLMVEDIYSGSTEWMSPAMSST
jgi:hypothetical protein